MTDRLEARHILPLCPFAPLLFLQHLAADAVLPLVPLGPRPPPGSPHGMARRSKGPPDMGFLAIMGVGAIIPLDVFPV